MDPSNPAAPEDGSRQARDAEAADTTDCLIIARARAELYAFWRDFTNLPKFMSGLIGVIEVDSLSSVWTVVDREGRTAEWEVIVTDDRHDQLIAWSTSGRTLARYRARVEFLDAADGRGTVVTATAQHAAPEGALEQLRELVEGPTTVMRMPGDLARLKSLMEAGEPVRVRETSLPSDAGSIARERGIIAPERDERIIAPERDARIAVSRHLQSNWVARRWSSRTACANVAATESTRAPGGRQ